MNTDFRKRARPGFRRMAMVVLLGWLVSVPAVGRAQQPGAADLFKQAQAYEDQQNYPAAENIYRKVLASDPDNLEALKHLGILRTDRPQI